MASDIPYDRAQLIAAILESVVYGIFSAFFVAAVYFLVTKEGKLNWMLLCTELSMFAVATAHLVVILAPAYEAFSNCGERSAVEHFLDLSRPYTLLPGVLYNFQIVIGDAFLLYRCYVIWGSRWQVIPIPLLFLVATTVCGFGQTGIASDLTSGNAQEKVRPWMIAVAVTTFGTNIVCTSLIIFKLHNVHKHLRGMAQRVRCRSSPSTSEVMIESAILYLAWVTTGLFLNAFGSNAKFIVYNSQPPLIGIAFSAIIIRISLGYGSSDAPGSGSDTSTHSRRHILTVGGTRRSACDDIEITSRTHPLQIRVDHLVESDTVKSPVAP